MKSTDRRFTPRWLIDLVVQALGDIELDPCSEAHNPTGATLFYTAEDDGLSRDWLVHGPVLTWVNPPFSALLTWVERAINAGCNGSTVVVLTPVDSTTRWYASLTEYADLAAPLRKRCRFGFPEDQEQPKSAANAACMLWLLGAAKPQQRNFAQVFAPHAPLYIPGLFPAPVAP